MTQPQFVQLSLPNIGCIFNQNMMCYLFRVHILLIKCHTFTLCVRSRFHNQFLSFSHVCS